MDVFARETNKFRVSASPSVCPFAAAVANTDRPTPFECDVALSHLEDRQIYRTKGHCDHMPQISNWKLVKVKGKGLDTWYSTAYMRRLVNSSALQSWKWQLIGMS